MDAVVTILPDCHPETQAARAERNPRRIDQGVLLLLQAGELVESASPGRGPGLVCLPRGHLAAHGSILPVVARAAELALSNKHTVTTAVRRSRKQ